MLCFASASQPATKLLGPIELMKSVGGASLSWAMYTDVMYISENTHPVCT